MKSNPLDAMPDTPVGAILTFPEDASARARRQTQPATGGAKVRATFHLPQDLLDAARAAVVQLSGPPVRLTLAQLAQNAIRAEVQRLQHEHNEGRPFPKPEAALRGGRPIGS
jgi:hypothetical protein